MKKKMILDVLMTIVFVCLMSIMITGMKWHEILGLFVFGLFCIHMIFNRNWIVGVTKKIHTDFEKIPTITKIKYFIDCTLFVLITIIIISGIFISKVLFTEMQLQNTDFWSNLHHFSAYTALILISVHVGMNWQQIMNGVKKMFNIQGINKKRTVMCRILVVIIMIAGIKGFFSSDMINFLTAPFAKDKSNSEKGTSTKNKTSYSQTSNTITTATASDETPSLEDFLGNLNCSGCGKSCPLLALKCSRGYEYQQQATKEYYEQYPDEEQSQSDSNSTSSSQLEVNIREDSEGEHNRDNSNDSKPEEIYKYLSIMGLFSGGTHYLVKFSTKKR